MLVEHYWILEILDHPAEFKEDGGKSKMSYSKIDSREKQKQLQVIEVQIKISNLSIYHDQISSNITIRLISLAHLWHLSLVCNCVASKY